MKLRLAIVALVVTPLLVAGLASLEAAKGTGNASDPVVAKVGNKTITLSELDEVAKKKNFKVFQQLHSARSSALDEMIGDILLEKEAKARGMTKDALVKQEIDAKITPVTDEQVEAWYNANKNRVRNRTLEQVAPQIKQFLAGQGSVNARTAYLDTLKKGTSVQLLLEPPRQAVELAANDPRKGPNSAPIQIVEYSDYQ
jgi:hypothetical protein